jgi:hypothetical protein
MDGVKVTHVACAGIIVALLSFAAPIFAREMYRSTVGTYETQQLPSPAPPEGFEPTAQLDVMDDPVDLYGNEVPSATSQYRTDGTGALYELHAPQVEIARLGSPTS